MEEEQLPEDRDSQAERARELIQEEIADQEQRLQIYRRNLKLLLDQAARRGGETEASVALANEIHETRANIQSIKTRLRDLSVQNVEDLRDEAPLKSPGPPSSLPSAPTDEEPPKPPVLPLSLSKMPEGRPDRSGRLNILLQPRLIAAIILAGAAIALIGLLILMNGARPTVPSPTAVAKLAPPTVPLTSAPRPTSRPTPTCGDSFKFNDDDIAYIAPGVKNGRVFQAPYAAMVAVKSCTPKREDRSYSIELRVRQISSAESQPPLWWIYMPSTLDVSDKGVLSLWLRGSQTEGMLKIGLQDANGHFGKYEAMAAPDWKNVLLPLADFRSRGVNLEEIVTIFIEFDGLATETVYVDEITFLPTTTWELKCTSLTGFSSESYGESKGLVDHFKQIGANCVSVLVTWYQNGQDTTTIERHPSKTPSDEGLKDVIEYIHSLGMKVLLDLHVDDEHLDIVDDSASSTGADRWRGRFNPADRTQWFNSYRRFAAYYAKLAGNEGWKVEIINIGSEQNSLTSSPEDVRGWLKIIQEVREQGYTGELVYTVGRRDATEVTEDFLASRWKELWEELDYAGTTVQYTLSDEAIPSVETLIQAWERHKQHLEDWQKTINKQILFTEVPYRSVEYCTRNPWKWRGSLSPTGAESLESAACQEHAYEAFLRTFGKEPWVAGAAWWNYDPPLLTSPYSPYDKPADMVVHRWYAGETHEFRLRQQLTLAPTQMEYDLETRKSMWVHQVYSDTQAVTMAIPKMRLEGEDNVLELTVSLMGSDPSRKQGEALLDLRYSYVPGVSDRHPHKPFNMHGRQIRCWIYAPGAPSGLTAQIFAKSLMGRNWWSAYGSPVPIEADKWIEVILQPDAVQTSDGYNDAKFDPAAVVAIGVKIGGSDEATYTGSIYVDKCGW
jgi:hypothetical protein